MVEAEIVPNNIFENDETEESDVSDLVDDRAVPKISIPNLKYRFRIPNLT